MKIIATLTPADVKPDPFRVRCLMPTCELARVPDESPSLDYAQGRAEEHVRARKHTVVIEAREDVVIHEFHGRTSR